MKKPILISIILLLALIGISSTLEPLTIFINKLGEVGSFSAELELEFHLLNTDNPEKGYDDFSIAFRIVLQNRSDCYLELKEPIDLNGISFVYLAKEDVLFSIIDEKPWKQYRSSIDMPIVNKLLNEFLWGLTEPSNFSWEKIEEAGLSIYHIKPNESRAKLLGLIGGGGYIPNIMNLTLAFTGTNGIFPEPLYLFINDRNNVEYLNINILSFDIKGDQERFDNLRKLFYESFKN